MAGASTTAHCARADCTTAADNKAKTRGTAYDVNMFFPPKYFDYIRSIVGAAAPAGAMKSGSHVFGSGPLAEMISLSR